MKCSNCGTVNASGSNYCTQCNYSLAAAPTAPAAPAATTLNVPATTPSTTATVAAPSATAYATAPGAAPASMPVAATTGYPTSARVAAPPYTPIPTNAPTGAPASYPAASARATAPAPSVPYAAYQQPYYYYQPITPKPSQPFTITDALIIIGFVLAIIGIFAYAFILLPASIAFSVTGFLRRTNSRTHGLSLAGIVVAVVACLIKLGLVLHELGFIPDWLSAGIF